MTTNDQPNTNAETTNAEQQPQEDQKLIRVTLKQTGASDEFPAYAQLCIHVCIRTPETRMRTQPFIFSKTKGRQIIQSLQKQDDNDPIRQLQFAPAIQALIQPQYVAGLQSCLAELEASDLPEGETRLDKLSKTTPIPITPEILETLLQVYDHISIAFIRAKREMPAHFSMKLTENDADGDALHFYSREAFREDIVKQRDEFGFLSDHQAAFFLAAITPNGDSYPDIPEGKTVYDDLVATRKIEHPCIHRENGKASVITAIQNAHAGIAANPKWTVCENCGGYHCGIHFGIYGIRLFTATDVETAEKIMPLLGSVFINEEQRETLFGQLCSIKARLADDEEKVRDKEDDDDLNEDDDLDEDEEKAWNGEGSTPASDDDSGDDEEDDENPNTDSLHPAVQPDEINEDPNDDDDAEDDPKGEIESDDEDDADNKGSEGGEHDDQSDTDEASPEPDDDHADPSEGPGEATPEPENVDGTTPSDPESPPVTPIPPTLRPEQSAPAPQADDQKAEEPLNAFTEQLRTDPVRTNDQTTAQT
ncbi:MAG: hypothetical protein KIH65_003440 [Candidatus Uhrbacteria bacterium]|nr:hypothetical protein [Candidatus Uhrbacteria bacterium]